jgi:4a-hydroxytetrahydrobiopterin dehydratase
MAVQANELRRKHCVACEGGIPAVSPAEARDALESLPDWKLSRDGKRIRREWRVKDFAAGLDFFQKVGELAEEEGHHPDLHLEGYRNLAIELYTHAVDGLTENDFILAAKIDEIPVALKEK